MPRVLAAAGDKVARRFLEFFAATIRKKNTRMAYCHACVRFFAWCDHHKIGEIADIEPLHVAAYVEALGKDFEKPTVKQHLAAIRMLFDWLVLGQVVATNPAHFRCAVRSTSSKPARPRWAETSAKSGPIQNRRKAKAEQCYWTRDDCASNGFTRNRTGEFVLPINHFPLTVTPSQDKLGSKKRGVLGSYYSMSKYNIAFPVLCAIASAIARHSCAACPLAAWRCLWRAS